MFPPTRTAVAAALVTAMSGAVAHAGTVNLTANLGNLHGTSTGTSTVPTLESNFDADNYVRARADVLNSAVGIGLATNGDASGFASAQLNEHWTASCAQGASCVLEPTNPVTYDFHVHGVLSVDWLQMMPGATNSFSGGIEIGTDSLSIRIGGPTGLEGKICGFSSCQDLRPFTLTQLADGTFSYDDVFSVKSQTSVELPTHVGLAAGWDPSGGPSLLGFMDTLSYDLISDNPDIIYTSDFGRTSLVAASEPPTTGVPEPGTIGLALAALVGFVLVPRKKLFPAASQSRAVAAS